MANTVIQLKKSGTPSAAPASLANGELAINYADGKLFYNNATNQVVSFPLSTTSSYGTVNANGTLLVSALPGDVFSILPGNNVIVTGDAINDRITIAANLDPVYVYSDTKLANTTGTFSGSLTVTGNVTAFDTITAKHFDNVSDKKLKENIKPITSALVSIEQLNPISFTWKADGAKSFGLIAQEVEKILPNIVHMENDIKTVSYVQIISLLIAAVKELNSKLDDLTK